MLTSLRELVPSLLAMEWMRIDTPSTFQSMVYDCDKREFARLGKKRNAFIRIEHPSEFDWSLSIVDRIKMPLLRVLVIRLEPGTHIRIPIFRGSEPVNTNVSSDAGVGIVLEAMARKLGMNLDECNAYETRVLMQSTGKQEAIN